MQLQNDAIRKISKFKKFFFTCSYDSRALPSLSLSLSLTFLSGRALHVLLARGGEK